MKILICGHAQHGKDSVGDLLCQINNFRASSSSKYAMGVMADQIMAYTGYRTFEECYAKRGEHRQYLYELIRDYNSPDKSRLSKEILVNHDIYVGMRDLEEFNASKHLFDIKIWVDSSARGVPLEDITSFNIPNDEFDLIILNSGTYEQLAKKVARLSFVLKDNRGKVIGTYCNGTDLHNVVSDGKGGTLKPDPVVEYNSERCGYSRGVTVKKMIEHGGYTK